MQKTKPRIPQSRPTKTTVPMEEVMKQAVAASPQHKVRQDRMNTFLEHRQAAATWGCLGLSRVPFWAVSKTKICRIVGSTRPDQLCRDQSQVNISRHHASLEKPRGALQETSMDMMTRASVHGFTCFV